MSDFFWVGGSSLRSANLLMYDVFSDLAETIRKDGMLVFGGEVQEKVWKERLDEETDTP